MNPERQTTMNDQRQPTEAERQDKAREEAEAKVRATLPTDANALARRLAAIGGGRPERRTVDRFFRLIRDMGANRAREGSAAILAYYEHNGMPRPSAEGLFSWLAGW